MTNEQEIKVKSLELAIQTLALFPDENRKFFLKEILEHDELLPDEVVIKLSRVFEKHLQPTSGQ